MTVLLRGIEQRKPFRCATEAAVEFTEHFHTLLHALLTALVGKMSTSTSIDIASTDIKATSTSIHDVQANKFKFKKMQL
jgi:hypothetical protein